MDLEKSGASLFPAGSRSTIPQKKKWGEKKKRKKERNQVSDFIALLHSLSLCLILLLWSRGVF